MNETIANLINAAGFSNTYERERLTELCKLVATVCIDYVVDHENRHDCIAAIVKDFNLNLENEQSS